jgi:hypothetical protein
MSTSLSIFGLNRNGFHDFFETKKMTFIRTILNVPILLSGRQDKVVARAAAKRRWLKRCVDKQDDCNLPILGPKDTGSGDDLFTSVKMG